MKNVLKIWSENGDNEYNTFILSQKTAQKVFELEYAGGFRRFSIDLMDELPNSHKSPLSQKGNLARFLSRIMGEKYETIYSYIK